MLKNKRKDTYYGVRKRSFRLMLKLRCSTPEGLARSAPLPRSGRGAGGEGNTPR